MAEVLMHKLLRRASITIRNLGVVDALLATFQKQELAPSEMDFVVGSLKTVMNLQEDPIEDLRCDTSVKTACLNAWKAS